MSNYIKIPVAANAARAFGSNITIAGDRLSWADAVGNVTSGTAGAASAEATTTVVPAGGSSATFKGATGSAQDPPAGSLAELTLTIEAAGNNYQVGDVITVAAATTGSETEWDEPISFTVTAADLVSIEGTTEPFEMIPIDDVVCVQTIEQGAATVANKLFIATTIASGDTTSTQSQFSGWTVEFDADNYDVEDCMASICEAIANADAAINSQPTVDFFGGAEVMNITYGANPST